MSEDKQTYCESIGLKVGDRIVALERNTKFKCGELLTLVEDDGSPSPRFKGASETGFFSLDTRRWRRVTDEPVVKESLTVDSTDNRPMTKLEQDYAERANPVPVEPVLVKVFPASAMLDYDFPNMLGGRFGGNNYD